MVLTVRAKGGLGLSGLIISIAIAGCSGSGAKPIASPTAKSGTLSDRPGVHRARVAVGRDNVPLRWTSPQRSTTRHPSLLHASGKAAYGPIPFSLTLQSGDTQRARPRQRTDGAGLGRPQQHRDPHHSCI